MYKYTILMYIYANGMSELYRILRRKEDRAEL